MGGGCENTGGGGCEVGGIVERLEGGGRFMGGMWLAGVDRPMLDGGGNCEGGGTCIDVGGGAEVNGLGAGI